MNWLTETEYLAVMLSLKVATWATICAFPIGLLVAFVLARRDFPGRQIFNGLVHLPLILPPVVTGYILLSLFGPLGSIGRILEAMGLGIAFRWQGAALAAGIMGFPLLVRALRLSIEAVDHRLEDAAATLGASPFWVFVTVTLPLIMPGIITGVLLCFAKAMGEFGATITFVANIPGETQTLPSAIYAALQVPGGEAPALRLVVISTVVAMSALALSEVLTRRVSRRLGAEGKNRGA